MLTGHAGSEVCSPDPDDVVRLYRHAAPNQHPGPAGRNGRAAGTVGTRDARVPDASDPRPETMMPLYEYRCRSCGHQFEIQQSINDDSLTECPECAGLPAQGVRTGGHLVQGIGLLQERRPLGLRVGSKSSGDSGSGSSSLRHIGLGSDSGNRIPAESDPVTQIPVSPGHHHPTAAAGLRPRVRLRLGQDLRVRPLRPQTRTDSAGRTTRLPGAHDTGSTWRIIGAMAKRKRRQKLPDAAVGTRAPGAGEPDAHRALRHRQRPTTRRPASHPSEPAGPCAPRRRSRPCASPAGWPPRR